MDERLARRGGRAARGGIGAAPAIKMAALANVYAGGTGWAVLTDDDPFVSQVRQAVAVESAKMAKTQEERLAKLIAYHVAKALGG